MEVFTKKEQVIVVGIGRSFNWTNKQTGEVVAMQHIHMLRHTDEKDFVGNETDHQVLYRNDVAEFAKENKGVGYYDATFECKPRDNKPASVYLRSLIFKSKLQIG